MLKMLKLKFTWLATCLLLISFSLILPQIIYASKDQPSANPKETIHLDQATILKGYTVSNFDDSFKLSLVPGILSQDTRVDTKIIPEEQMTLPWRLDRLSDIFVFDFTNKGSYDNHKPFYIQVSYKEASDDYKRVFFFDKNYNQWRPLPTVDYPKEKFVRSLIHLPYARLAVFSNPEIMTSGKASWYAFKGGDFTASPDFPRGSKLRVFNLANNKFVDVEVNDYGPDRKIHPDRAVDLDKQAFAKIASLGAGIIDVKVEPLYISTENSSSVFGLGQEAGELYPDLDSKSGIIINSSGEIIWSNNEDEILPIASLTKLIAIKVFLNQGIPLEKEVVYLQQDADYNHEHCSPWESARINLKPGDVVTAQDLIFSSLVGSANNSVETLIRVSGLTRQKFINQMNDYVSLLGAVNSSFVEPTGLSADNVSTAKEYAIIMRDVLEEPIIRQASTARTYQFTTVNTGREFNLRNTNHLLQRTNLNPYSFDIIGSKTGFINKSGYCLAVEINNLQGENFIALIMNASSRNDSFEQIENLINFGLRNNK